MTIKYLFFSVAATLMLCACNTNEILSDDPDNDSPETGVGSASVKKVFEWTPAPGQFINDETGGQVWPLEMTADEAAERARERLSKRYTVSLGAFGGYLVAGFDHSVENTGNYEIGILGNAFSSAAGNSNEPGIVYVMRDVNGNGMPDDTWYELKGSDTFDETTVRNYSVTYYRPEGDNKPVRWTDSLGESGIVAYVAAFHTQLSYYPVWIKEDSYTLAGTRLEARTAFNAETGNWSTFAFEWGYADNCGSDNIDFEGVPNCSRFRISDAVDAKGNPVQLPSIDFVKVQTGVNASCGWLGEVSTEILDIVDLTLVK